VPRLTDFYFLHFGNTSPLYAIYPNCKVYDMKLIYGYAVLVLTIISCNNSTSPASNTEEPINTKSEQAKEAISQINKQVEGFYKRKQLDSLVAEMADSVIQLPPNGEPLRGKASVKNYWNQLLQSGTVDFSLQTQEVKACGRLAIERGSYQFKFSPDKDSPIPVINDLGNYLVYWENINGQWKVVWDAPVSSVTLNKNMK
jgi:ketosteroid isomerase-like protein